MTVLVPAVALISGFLIVLLLTYRNILHLDTEASERWCQTHKARILQLDALTALYAELPPNKTHEALENYDIETKIQACRKADDPAEATIVDSNLASALRDFASKTDMQQLAASPAATQAIDALQSAEEKTQGCQRLYNNAATLYNNAGVTFPAILIAKLAKYDARTLYQPLRFRRSETQVSNADSESLAEKSPLIMNAYMLWAVGMSDATLEEADG